MRVEGCQCDMCLENELNPASENRPELAQDILRGVNTRTTHQKPICTQVACDCTVVPKELTPTISTQKA